MVLLSKVKIALENSSFFNKLHINVEYFPNYYGINKNVFKIYVSSSNKIYFAKISHKLQDKIAQELISKYIKTPKKIISIPFENSDIEVYEFIQGKLFTDIILEKEIDEQSILFLEDSKNKALLNLYSETQTTHKYKDILDSKVNILYKDRFMGNRYTDYYNNGEFKSLFSKNLEINGKKYPPINTIINTLREKYINIDLNANTNVILGHGDSHHQNILVQENSSDIYFIDHEYNSYTTMNMEIAKSYYIDLLGIYFFFFNGKLLDIFNVDLYEIEKFCIKIKIKLKNKPDLRIKIAENKINTQISLLKNCNDQLSINDYLLMNHLLSRNPIKYSPQIMPIFLAYIVIINIFNPLEPETLFASFN